MHWLVLVISEWTKDTLTWGAMGRITFGGEGKGLFLWRAGHYLGRGEGAFAVLSGDLNF